MSYADMQGFVSGPVLKYHINRISDQDPDPKHKSMQKVLNKNQQATGSDKLSIKQFPNSGGASKIICRVALLFTILISWRQDRGDNHP